MKRLSLIAIALPALLVACTQGQLDQKLSGKSRAQQQDILISECRRETNPPYTTTPARIAELNTLCDAMIKEMKNSNAGQ